MAELDLKSHVCRYDRREAVPNWPPPVEGPKATATRWWARLSEGALVLARTSNIGDADLVPVVHLPLAGCRCASCLNN